MMQKRTTMQWKKVPKNVDKKKFFYNDTKFPIGTKLLIINENFGLFRNVLFYVEVVQDSDQNINLKTWSPTPDNCWVGWICPEFITNYVVIKNPLISCLNTKITKCNQCKFFNIITTTCTVFNRPIKNNLLIPHWCPL